MSRATGPVQTSSTNAAAVSVPRQDQPTLFAAIDLEIFMAKQRARVEATLAHRLDRYQARLKKAKVETRTTRYDREYDYTETTSGPLANRVKP